MWLERGCLTVLDVLLSVEEPVWDLVLAGVGDDGDDPLHLLFAQLTGTLGHVNVGLQLDYNCQWVTSILSFVL